MTKEAQHKNVNLGSINRKSTIMTITNIQKQTLVLPDENTLFHIPTASKCSKLEGDPQVHTIFIKENRSKVLEVLPSKLYDYSANTCEKSVLKDIPGEYYGLICKYVILQSEAETRSPYQFQSSARSILFASFCL